MFVGIGLLMLAVCVTSITVSLLRGDPCPVVSNGLFGLLGVAALGHGVWALLDPGRV